MSTTNNNNNSVSAHPRKPSSAEGAAAHRPSTHDQGTKSAIMKRARPLTAADENADAQMMGVCRVVDELKRKGQSCLENSREGPPALALAPYILGKKMMKQRKRQSCLEKR